MKKLLVTFLLVLSVFVIFSSCGKDQATTTSAVTDVITTQAPVTTVKATVTSSLTSSTADPTTAASTTAAPVSIPNITEAPITEAPMLLIAKNAETQYIITCEDDASKNVKMSASKLANGVKDLYDIDLPIISVSEDTSQDNKRIVIRRNDDRLTTDTSYIIKVADAAIFVCSKSDEILDYAISQLLGMLSTKNIDSDKFVGINLLTDINADLGESFAIDDWGLRIPSFTAGKLCEGIYNCGSSIASYSYTDTDSFMRIATETTADNYKAYIEKAKSMGYVIDFENQIDDNLYTLLKDKYTERRAYVYYIAKTGETKLIDERSSTADISQYAYSYIPKEGDKTTFYQYSLYYDPNCEVTSKTENCGMFYIIKAADNSLICIDGGAGKQASNNVIEGLFNFMYEITGTPIGEKLKISAWVFTHPHYDHITLALKFLRRHGNSVDLQRIMLNYSCYADDGSNYDGHAFSLDNLIKESFPDTLILKAHSGEKIQLADVALTVLYTQEDGVKSSVKPLKRVFSGINSLSLVFKVEFSGKSVMMLADTTNENEALMIKMYKTGTFKSDIVQVAHHGLHALGIMYRNIKAPIALLPNANISKFDAVRDAVKKAGGDGSEVYFAGDKTYGFTWDGTKWVITETARIGGEYDGSGEY